MTTDRYFPEATADQLSKAAEACRRASWGGDEEWDSETSADAHRLTDALGWSWDFTTWSHAASILEAEAVLAQADEGHPGD